MAKITKNQRLWLEETANIRARLHRLRVGGIDTEDIVIPKRPEVITHKQIAGLKKVSEEVTRLEHRLQEEKDIKIKNKIKQNLIEDGIKRTKIEQAEIRTGHHSVMWDMYEYIKFAVEQAQASRGKGANILADYLQLLEETYGTITTAAIFYKAQQNGITITNEILYDSDGSKATPFISQVTNFIKDREDYDIFKEQVHKLFEYYDTLESVDEYEV